MLVAAVALIMQTWSPGERPSPAGTARYAAQAAGVSNTAVTGVVRDPAGGIIPGATVVARTGGHEQQSVTGVDGRFAMSIEPGAEVVITVQASGFAEATKTVRPGTIATGLEFVLAPERVTEAVTVTATRGERRTSDVPASVNVLGREDIKQSPAVVADDVSATDSRPSASFAGRAAWRRIRPRRVSRCEASARAVSAARW